MKPIHDAAATGYQVAADVYERGRPDYPRDAIQHLFDATGVRSGTILLDLGAGTGKFTKLAASAGATVIAIEPVAAMREKIALALPDVQVLAGTAESIPVQDGSVDAVIAAQAFHWFDGPAALAEVYRILKPGGHLGLIWNVRDESVEWVAGLTGIIDAWEGDAPRYRTGRWKEAFRRTTLFDGLVERAFRHAHSGPPGMIEDRVLSTSFISALPHARQKEVLRQVRELIGSHPETRGKSVIHFPYRTDVYTCKRGGVIPRRLSRRIETG